MEIISEKFYKSISGGVAMITKDGSIMVTGNTPMFINNVEFYSSGIIKIGSTTIDFNINQNFYYDSYWNRLITATKIEGGYIYSFQNTVNNDYYKF